jgi:hypothetical protein
MDAIFEALEKNIRKSPNNITEYVKNAKEEVESMLSQKNYAIFENIISQMNIIVCDE